MRQYRYKEERHPQKLNEMRLLVTWDGYGWWHKLGDVVDHPQGQTEAWTAHGLEPGRGGPRLFGFGAHEEAVAWLKKLWEERQTRR